MEFLIFIVSGLALAWGMMLHSRLRAMETIMDAMGNTLRNLGAGVGVLDQRLTALEGETHIKALRESGVLQFKPETLVRVALATHPRVAEILTNHSIAVDKLAEDERETSLESLAESKGTKLEPLLQDLNGLLEEATTEELRRPDLISLE